MAGRKTLCIWSCTDSISKNVVNAIEKDDTIISKIIRNGRTAKKFDAPKSLIKNKKKQTIAEKEGAKAKLDELAVGAKKQLVV